MTLFKSTKQVELCPQCNSPLQLKQGKKGLFLGCSIYPECDYIKPLHQANHIIKELDECCSECGHHLQLKQGIYGIFIGCSNYPECNFIVQEEADVAEEFSCPECKQHKLLVRKGRSGRTFYGCAGFPNCKFTLNTKPIKYECEKCDYELAIIKKIKGKQYYICANKNCEARTQKEVEF
ncbi:topoisomerase DNA-binding C4 zinc finger domain-containing protein [Mannheimia pernigra]|uniref:Topoisomerase DNA-binding C4 zinc finger domain-containing protein n=1 Tax=Mannheimia pernigra TaxID=111844 RepID=A0A7D5DY15_9PAST|nr:topoisomerase DNA-binding C4 zinc finger domain-containing protein [Mannheimia pernigra]QLB40283.1 topoisomerase DNA-binding C4 zinc finger domain-containing protein [Mannheimia pernigra]QLB42281.1 topoisomerase DNA-binding C4 zinc finger domain-containing protein [Mannheimia pernigra]